MKKEERIYHNEDTTASQTRSADPFNYPEPNIKSWLPDDIPQLPPNNYYYNTYPDYRNEREFVIWLRGYIQAHDSRKTVDIDVIMERLNKLAS